MSSAVGSISVPCSSCGSCVTKADRAITRSTPACLALAIRSACTCDTKPTVVTAASAGSALSAATASSGRTRWLLRSRMTRRAALSRTAATIASGERANAISTPSAFAALEIRDENIRSSTPTMTIALLSYPDDLRKRSRGRVHEEWLHPRLRAHPRGGLHRSGRRSRPAAGLRRRREAHRRAHPAHTRPCRSRLGRRRGQAHGSARRFICTKTTCSLYDNAVATGRSVRHGDRSAAARGSLLRRQGADRLRRLLRSTCTTRPATVPAASASRSRPA